ncbi:uncharacterized protein LOC122808876 [Protopterus annectens]|uniref:uncharacterized protein LOC122808876 n=1 Tax=Protopterus annectens TaxID=7888 RepID=UPI001CFAE5C5|nr:uncharacterized protein LOC122808876 [Protopterus annectens]
MTRLSEFFISLCAAVVSAQLLKRPDIRVKFHNAASALINVSIECRWKEYRYTFCTFDRNENTVAYLSNSYSSPSGILYAISNVTKKHEGFYSCECSVPNRTITETSFRVPLILSEKLEEPEIKMEENGTIVACASKNNRYKYRLCILYQNGQQIQDSGGKYNENHAGRIVFSISDVPNGNYFNCLCYTAEPSGWTKISSSVIKGEKRGALRVETIIKICICAIEIPLMIIFVVDSICSKRKK